MLEKKSYVPLTQELPIQDIYVGEQQIESEYTVDILVVGGGYAGLNAAYTAKMAGKNVMLVDKGRPGFSGQSAWPGTLHFVDKEMGDDIESYREMIRYDSEGMGNLDWVDIFIQESKGIYERIKSWGILERYPRFCESEYWKDNDAATFRKKIIGNRERHFRFTQMLDNNDIPWLQHVMINNLIVQNGNIAGAVGFQVTTGKIVRVNARAVILACGNGVVSAGSFCVGGNSFDGEYMAYNLGLPIGGKEYEDFHVSSSFATGNAWINMDTSYIDNIYLCGGFYDRERLEKSREKYYGEKTKKQECSEGLPYLYGYPLSVADPSKNNIDKAVVKSKAYGVNPAEVRTGKYVSPRFRADGAGAAIGMCLHLASGVYCGMDNFDGATAINGLYVAGDGMHLTQPNGATYTMGNGTTCVFVSMCGDHAGKAAAGYCDTVPEMKILEENFEKARKEIEAPLKKEKGFDPNWARDVLMGIMAPYWVSKVKSEETLKAALTNVEYLRDHVADNLVAGTPHALRLCHEMKHKINSCELKLRASLERKESRGTFFREDYPERDDAYAGYILIKKDRVGNPEVSFVKTKSEWAINEEKTDEH